MVTEIIKFISCRGKYSEISFSVVCIKTKSTGAEIVLCQGHSSLGRLVGVLERTKKNCRLIHCLLAHTLGLHSISRDGRDMHVFLNILLVELKLSVNIYKCR